LRSAPGQEDGDRAVSGAEIEHISSRGRRRRLTKQDHGAEIDRLRPEDASISLQLEIELAQPRAHRPRARRDGWSSYEVVRFGYTHRLSPNRLLPHGNQTTIRRNVCQP